MDILKVSLFWLAALTPIWAMDDYRATEVSLLSEYRYKEADSIDRAFGEGKFEGRLRLAYIYQNEHADALPSSYGTSLGGQLKYETAKIKHLSLGASVFVSEKIGSLSGDKNKGELNPDFFNENGDSFAYVGEAYVDYAKGHFDLRIGRQNLDTPLNDRDDIRMLPNTFEAAMAGYGGIKDCVVVAGYINRWAGYDSGDDIAAFKELPGGTDSNGEKRKGLMLAGIMNESFENIGLQAWYYDFDKQAGVTYLEALYNTEYKNGLSVETGLQYANYSEFSSSGIAGDVYGGIFHLGYAGLGLGAAFNDTHSPSGKTIMLGYGGGPYFSSMEEMTIDAMNDAEAYVFGADIDLAKAGFEGVSLAYAFGRFKGNDETGESLHYEESDLVAIYTMNDNADVEASYAHIEDKNHSGTSDKGYNRLLVRANYRF